MQSVSVIVCRFDPAGYELPRKHFIDSVNQLSGGDFELVVVQAILPGQEPEAVPEGAVSLVVDVKTVFFRKENLWNYGARRSKGDILIFLDSDVFFEGTDWVKQTCDTLATCDVAQPFETGIWLDKQGNPVRSREAVGNALAEGCTPNLGKYHPGFGWAMTRSAFIKIGGFYDRCVSGSGDAAFTFGFTTDEQMEPMLPWWRQNDRFFLAPSYAEWRKRTLSLGLKIGRHPGGKVFHRWHGTMSGRKYVERDALFPKDELGEYPVLRRKDDILEWGSDEGDVVCRKYFGSRSEDGGPPWIFGIGTAKSGTNSLAKALGIIGLDCRHCGGDVAAGRTEIVDAIEKNRSCGNPIFEGITDVDALVDWPIHELYEEIASQYPEARFILTYRPPHDVAVSWIRMVLYRGEKSQGIGADWPEYTRTYSGFMDYAERHVSDVLRFFADKPGRLMILDCRDSDESIWKRLCGFTMRPERKVVAKYPRAFSHEQEV